MYTKYTNMSWLSLARESEVLERRMRLKLAWGYVLEALAMSKQTADRGVEVGSCQRCRAEISWGFGAVWWRHLGSSPSNQVIPSN